MSSRPFSRAFRTCGSRIANSGRQARRSAMIDLEASIDSLSISNDYQVVERLCQLLQKHGKDLESENQDKLCKLFKTLKIIAGSTHADVRSRWLLLQMFKLRANGWNEDQEKESHEDTHIVILKEKQEVVNPDSEVQCRPRSHGKALSLPKHVVHRLNKSEIAIVTLTQQQAQMLILNGKTALQDLCLSCKVEITFHQDDASPFINAKIKGNVNSIREAKKKLYNMVMEENNLASDQTKAGQQNKVQTQARCPTIEPSTVVQTSNILMNKQEDWDLEVEKEDITGFICPNKAPITRITKQQHRRQRVLPNIQTDAARPAVPTTVQYSNRNTHTSFEDTFQEPKLYNEFAQIDCALVQFEGRKPVNTLDVSDWDLELANSEELVNNRQVQKSVVKSAYSKRFVRSYGDLQMTVARDPIHPDSSLAYIAMVEGSVLPKPGSPALRRRNFAMHRRYNEESDRSTQDSNSMQWTKKYIYSREFLLSLCHSPATCIMPADLLNTDAFFHSMLRASSLAILLQKTASIEDC